jgi:hypothetical protein
MQAPAICILNLAGQTQNEYSSTHNADESCKAFSGAEALLSMRYAGITSKQPSSTTTTMALGGEDNLFLQTCDVCCMMRHCSRLPARM